MNCVESIAEKNVKGVCIEPGEDSFAISKTINGSTMALDVAGWGGLWQIKDAKKEKRQKSMLSHIDASSTRLSCRI